MEDLRNNLLFQKAGEFTLLVRNLILKDEEGEHSFPLSYLTIKRNGNKLAILRIVEFEREEADVIFVNRIVLKTLFDNNWEIEEISY